MPLFRAQSNDLLLTEGASHLSVALRDALAALRPRGAGQQYVGLRTMMDKFNPSQRSRIMAAVKSRGNRSTEGALVRVLRRAKINGWRRGYPLFGRPDFVFPHQRVAVFVDGCFWHGHPQYCRVPRAHRAYWLRKIARNMERDKLVTRTLQRKGWTVIRIWENTITRPSTVVRLRRVLT